MIRVTIEGRFHGLNDFIDANRRTQGKWNAGNSMKQNDQKIIMYSLPRVQFSGKVFLHYHFFEPNTRRDKDNISGYFHKVFQDAMVAKGIIPNDGWKYIEGMADSFYVDRNRPRVEVEIYGENVTKGKNLTAHEEKRRHHER